MSSVSQIGAQDTAVYQDYKTTPKAADVAEVKTEKNDVAAVFEKSDAVETDSAKKTYKPNTELVAQLKKDADERTAQLRSIVEKLISGQGNAFAISQDDDSIWKMFAEGKFENVDEAAIAQAKEDIAEGGYYSVEKTSERILDFAKALTGGDPSKIDAMRSAFEKGFGEATKAWGKDLPEISSKTYDAVMKGFDDWKNEAAKVEE